MRIDFFTTNGGMDKRAIKGGVYHVELLKKDLPYTISLYIGESVCIAVRCGEHLYSFYADPGYFGLKSEDLNNDELTLRFSVLQTLVGRKCILGVKRYKDLELKYIQKEIPITQLRTSDRQIKNKDEKIQVVQEEMLKKGFK